MAVTGRLAEGLRGHGSAVVTALLILGVLIALAACGGEPTAPRVPGGPGTHFRAVSRSEANPYGCSLTHHCSPSKPTADARTDRHDDSEANTYADSVPRCLSNPGAHAGSKANTYG